MKGNKNLTIDTLNQKLPIPGPSQPTTAMSMINASSEHNQSRTNNEMQRINLIHSLRKYSSPDGYVNNNELYSFSKNGETEIFSDQVAVNVDVGWGDISTQEQISSKN